MNAATLVTGAQPATHGIVGNQMYVPAADPARAIGTDSYRRLLDVDRATGGRLVHTLTLAERLQARGLRLAAVSSGSTGSAAPPGAGAGLLAALARIPIFFGYAYPLLTVAGLVLSSQQWFGTALSAPLATLIAAAAAVCAIAAGLGLRVGATHSDPVEA